MTAMHRTAAFAAVLLLSARLVSGVDCDCDATRPETLEVRQCSLCREAEKQPADVRIFYLKDINPRKPNRWLVLPRKHGTAQHHLHDMTLDERTALWTAAIKKAKELWGDEWGVAYNGEKVRTQCHTHIHIGKLLRGVERDNYIIVSKPSQIPARKGEGMWVHPVNGRLHVHVGEQTCETVLLR
jgi:hypothetical protein